jgi:hypothetical protein
LLIQNKCKRNIQAAKQLQIAAKTPNKTAENHYHRSAVNLNFLEKKRFKKRIFQGNETKRIAPPFALIFKDKRDTRQLK